MKMNEITRRPTDPAARQFVKTFYQLQKQKEQFHLQLHNEVIQWRLMYQRGIAYKFEQNDKVNMLIKEFVRLHEQLDEFLEQERKKLELILPKPRYFMPSGCKDNKKGEKSLFCKDNDKAAEKDELELTPEAMQRLVCFQKCNDQHILVLTQVLSDIEDCKTFAKAQKASASSSQEHSLSKQQSLTESAESSTNRPITITVSTDSEEAE